MANSSDPKPCRFTPLTPVTIQDRFYRNGHWVADLSCAYIWWNDKSLINTEMIQEREEVLRSNQAEHVTIRARNQPRPHPDQPGDELIGAYFALWLPVFALQSRTCKTQFYVSKSVNHHFSLYYMPPVASPSKTSKFIANMLTESLDMFKYYRACPLEYPFAYAGEFFRKVHWHDASSPLKTELIMYMTDDQIDFVCDQDPACIVAPPEETAAITMRRIRHRDANRFHGLEALSATLEPRSDELMEVVLEGGLVKGEAKVLLSFLLDTLVYKCQAWNQGYLEHTAVLGSRNWHVSAQAGGAAVCSKAPCWPPQ